MPTLTTGWRRWEKNHHHLMVSLCWSGTSVATVSTAAPLRTNSSIAACRAKTPAAVAAVELPMMQMQRVTQDENYKGSWWTIAVATTIYHAMQLVVLKLPTQDCIHFYHFFKRKRASVRKSTVKERMYYYHQRRHCYWDGRYEWLAMLDGGSNIFVWEYSMQRLDGEWHCI